MRLIDTHCHLDYEYDGKTAAQIVAEAKADQVYPLMTIGVDASSVERLQKISDEIPGVFHSTGVHPHEAEKMTDADFEKIRQAAAHPKCLAIGEIGLDYHYDHSPRETQRQVFDRLLALAVEVNLPVVIHSREGEADLIVGLEKYVALRQKGAHPDLCHPGIIHCFTGTAEFAKRAVQLGFMISFSGILTFKNAQAIREVAAWVPESQILVETDSPYLAPVPHRGKKCEPRFVRHTAEFLAQIRGISVEKLALTTTTNAERVFRFPEVP
ncbi:MAG: TatD family hydrolase [Bdellovibrionales bacterium]|nr:TatD family hydrolase [Bdellovibrionales bacterium]